MAYKTMVSIFWATLYIHTNKFHSASITEEKSSNVSFYLFICLCFFSVYLFGCLFICFFYSITTMLLVK